MVADWIAAHGADDQRARLAAGVLPLDEAIDAMTTQVFAGLARLPRYERDGAARLQAHLRTFAAHCDAVVSAATLSVSSRELREATSALWAVMQQIQRAAPNARVYLRERVLAWTEQPTAPKLRMVTVVAFAKFGPITLRREFRVPEPCVPVPETDGEVE